MEIVHCPGSQLHSMTGKESWRKRRRRRREQSCCCPTALLPTPLLPCHIAEVSVDAGVHQFTLRPTSCSPRAPVANIIRPSNGMLTSRYVRCDRMNPCRSWTKFYVCVNFSLLYCGVTRKAKLVFKFQKTIRPARTS